MNITSAETLIPTKRLFAPDASFIPLKFTRMRTRGSTAPTIIIISIADGRPKKYTKYAAKPMLTALAPTI